MAGSGTTDSMANVLKAAWIAITAKSEPVRSYTRHCPTPNSAMIGRMIAVSMPWKCREPNTMPSISAADHTGSRVRRAR